MARYFAVNSLAGCSRTSTAVVESTTAGKFDSAYVPNAILVPNTTDYATIKQPFLDGSTSLTALFYLRFDLNPFNSVSTRSMMMFNAGANAYQLILVSGNTYQFQYWNSGTSAWVNWGGTFTMNAAAISTVVIKLNPNSAYEIFLAGASVASSSTVPTNGAGAVDEFRFCATSNSGCYWSQIMCADYDIRDAHLMTAALNGNSATNTSGTGAYTDVNETVLDESTAIVLASAGKKGQTKASITVPGGLGIAALVINARGRVSGGTITDGKLGVRSGGANYSSTGRSYNGGYEPRSAIWTADPATSGAWTQTSFNNAEIYEEAA